MDAADHGRHARAVLTPIQDVLHRVQWDPAWRGSAFEVGYLDRVAGLVVRVPLGAHRIEAGPPPSLACHDPDGHAVHIPLHRIRTVWRDGAVIWERPPAGALQWPHDGDPHA